MSGSWKLLGAVAAAMLAGVGVVAAQEAGAPPAKGPGDRGMERFKAMDTDGNGTISLAEFKVAQEKRMAERKAKMGDKWDEARAAKMPTAEQTFKRLDTDGNGALTPEELRREGRAKGPRAGHGQGAEGGAPAAGGQ